MSLFIGKDNANVPILHMTSSVNEVSEMKSGLLSSTTFHSSLKYIMYDIYPSISEVYTYMIGSTYYFATAAKFSTSAIAKLSSKKYVHFFTYFSSYANSEICHVGAGNPWGIISSTYYNKTRWYSTSDPTSAYSYIPSDAYSWRIIYIGTGGLTVNHGIKLIALNIYEDAGAFYYENPKDALISDEIIVDNGDIVIGGMSIKDLKFFSPSTVNSVDYSFKSGTTSMQLLNSSTKSGISLSANSTEVKIEDNAGQLLFSTLSTSFGKMFYHSLSSAVVVPKTYLTEDNLPLYYVTIDTNYAYTVGQSFICVVTIHDYTDTINDKYCIPSIFAAGSINEVDSYQYSSSYDEIAVDLYGEGNILKVRFRMLWFDSNWRAGVHPKLSFTVIRMGV